MKLIFPASDRRSRIAVINEKRPWIQQGAECKLVVAQTTRVRHAIPVHFIDCPYPKVYDLVSSDFLKGKSAIPKGVRV